MSGSFHASVSVDNSNLQAVIAVIRSAPNADGNFDRNNNFSAAIADGVSNLSLFNGNASAMNEYAGEAAYILPASKGEPSFPDAFDIVNIIAACLCPGWSAATPVLTLVSFLYSSSQLCPSDSQRPHASAILP